MNDYKGNGISGRSLHYLLRQNRYRIFFKEIIACDPSIYTMDLPDLTVSNFMVNSIGTKRDKGSLLCKYWIKCDGDSSVQYENQYSGQQ